jgi:PAS domain S-box-containing protein
MIWPIIQPFAWFLFTPAVFLSAWIGGRWLGSLASVVATLLVWYFFLPPERSFTERTLGETVAALTFLGTGVIFSLFHDRLKRANLRVAEALAASRYQAQLESAFHAIQDGIVVTDRRGAIILVNEAEARLNGFPSAEAMKQNLTFFQDLYELRDADGKPLPFQEWPINKVLKGKSIRNLELRTRRRDTGQEWLFSFSGEPVRDEEGQQILAVVGTRDITDQKLAEEGLRAGENRLRAIFENAAVGIGRVSPDGRWLEVNQRLCDIVGYTREELMMKTFADITHPEDLEADWRQARQLLAGEIETYSMEKRYLRRDGSTIWVNLTASLVRKADGSPEYFIPVVEDISTRRQAEEKLRGSEERLRLALTAAGLGVFEWNVPADVAVWENDRMYEIFGHTRADGTLSKERLTEKYIHPDDVATFGQALADGMKSGRPVHAIYRIRRKDGAIRSLDLASSFELSRDGVPIRMVGVLADITEQREAEQKIRASEQQFRVLADTAPVLIWVAGTDKLCTFFNKPWLDFTGRTMEEEMGNGWTEGVHPDDFDRCVEIYGTSFEARKPFQMEYRLLRNDGEYRWIVDNGIPRFSPNGDFLGYIGSCIDITGRKQAEAEREQLTQEQAVRAEAEHSAERIRRLQAATDAALGRVALGDLLNETLRRVRELLEADSAAILLTAEDGRWVKVHATVGLQDGALGVQVPIGQGLAGTVASTRAPLVVEDISSWNVINPVLRKYARSFLGVPLLTEGRLIGVMHVDTVKARQFTESDIRLLQLAADRIALAIEQARLYELEHQARRQAEEANRMKDEFLALVSHELRSPLNAMLGYARLLRFGPVDSQTLDKALDVIERGGKAQTHLIDDLLDTARIISGKLRIDVGPVDLVGVVEGAVQTIYPAADAKGITIRTDLNPRAGQITGDAERLQQVIWNLLSNAVKFTPSGGRVEVCLEREDPHISITVSDTGKGISPEFLPYIFDRFRQADASSARRYGGLGLGLALVKYLVELHGGTIEASSGGEGTGSTFKVLLPVRAVSGLQEPQGTLVSAVATEQPILAGARVLVVDDEDDARELVKTVLSHEGADVVLARSAAEAFEMITTAPDQTRPNVIVADLGLPEEDGYSMLRRMREWEREHGVFIPAVALTAYGRTEDRMRALRAGFQLHVAKPVEPVELAVVVASVLRPAA